MHTRVAPLEAALHLEYLEVEMKGQKQRFGLMAYFSLPSARLTTLRISKYLRSCFGLSAMKRSHCGSHTPARWLPVPSP